MMLELKFEISKVLSDLWWEQSV